MYLVVIATSLFVVNVVAKKYPMMGVGRSTMMEEERMPSSSYPYSEKLVRTQIKESAIPMCAITPSNL